jgi:hypothetical protein
LRLYSLGAVSDVLEMPRPHVDVVAPFRGDTEALARLTAALATLHRRPGDTITIVDNTPGVDRSETSESHGIRTVVADELATPGYARNAGAGQGNAGWVVYIDADTQPDADLLDRYFDPVPGPATGLLAGGVVDEPVAPRTSAAARYAYLKDSMSQCQTFRLAEWGFAQLANAACRRRALEDWAAFGRTSVPEKMPTCAIALGTEAGRSNVVSRPSSCTETGRPGLASGARPSRLDLVGAPPRRAGTRGGGARAQSRSGAARPARPSRAAVVRVRANAAQPASAPAESA